MFDVCIRVLDSTGHSEFRVAANQIYPSILAHLKAGRFIYFPELERISRSSADLPDLRNNKITEVLVIPRLFGG